MNDERTSDARSLIAALLGPSGPELTCDECFEWLDRHVDLLLAECDGDRAVPGMRAHLRGCTACGADCESWRHSSQTSARPSRKTTSFGAANGAWSSLPSSRSSAG
jgi:hypothetical protein